MCPGIIWSVAVRSFSRSTALLLMPVLLSLAGTASAGNFSGPLSSIPLPGAAAQGALVDLNGDGYLDYVAPIRSVDAQYLEVLLGNGSGTFTEVAAYGGLTWPTAVAAGDLNRDGKPDVVVTQCGQGMQVYLGNGDGTLTPGISTTVGGCARSVVLADMNRDGLLDIVLASSGADAATIFYGDGNGSFSSYTSYVSGYYTGVFSVAVTDQDHDGWLDLIIAYLNSNVVLMVLNPGGTGYVGHRVYPITGPRVVVVEDINKDGWTDTVVLAQNNVGVAFGGGGGGVYYFNRLTLYPVGSYPASVVVEDLDRDGFLDIATANTSGNSLSVLRNLGDATFEARRDYPVSAGPASIAAGDVDRDGFPDLVLGATSLLATFLNNTPDYASTTAGTYLKTVGAYLTAGSPVALASADFDRNGTADVVTVQDSSLLSYWVGDGTGTLTHAWVLPLPASPRGVVAGELTGDAYPDIAIAFASGPVRLYRGNAGTFTEIASFTTPVPTAGGIVMGDFDGDGSNDVAVTLTDGSVTVARVSAGAVLSTATYPSGLAPGFNAVSLAAADVNRDGWLDLLVGRSNDGNLIWLRNNYGFTFTADTTTALGTVVPGVAIRDFDRDGILDVAWATGPGGVISARKGDGLGNFPGTPYSLGVGNVEGMVAADINGDGIPDLLTPTLTDLRVLNGGGAYNNFTAGFTEYSTSLCRSIITADLNGDGRADVLTACPMTNTLRVLLNVNRTTITTQVTPTTAVTGEPVNISATITQPQTALPGITGEVLFEDGSTVLGTAATTGSAGTTSAALSAPFTTAGVHAIVAHYKGSTAYSPQSAWDVLVTINKATTKTVVATSETPAAPGAALTLTATLSVVAPGAGTPTGDVNFYDGATLLGAATLTGNSAAMTIAALAIGSHSIKATYVGDAGYLTSTSNPVTQVISRPTTLALSSAVSPSVVGQNVWLTATVTSSDGSTPPGTVQFDFDYNGTFSPDVTATVNASGSAATVNGFIVASAHDVMARYVPSNIGWTTSSGVMTQTVNQASTTTVVSSSQNPSVYGVSVGFNVTVATVSPGNGFAAGTVTCKEGATVLGTATLTTTGTAVVNTTALAAGVHVIGCEYAGNSNYQGSASTTVAQTVNKATLTVAATDASRVYGGNNPAFTGNVTGVVTGDGITASYSTTATPASGVGTYAITPTLNDPNMKLANYTVSSTDGTLTVTRAALSVTANSKARVYGTANPAFDGTVTGVVAGDSITASYSTPATAASGVGQYAITASLNDPGNRLGNYTVTATDGTLTISPATLTVSAYNKQRIYGAANPVFDGTLSGVVVGDGITATYSTAATTSSAAGDCAITATLNDPNNKLGNYNVTNTPGTLTITKATLTVAATNKQRTYGASNPGLDGTLSGVVAGDGITATYSTAATTSSAAGDYTITATLNDPNNKLGNYNVTNMPGMLTITQAILTVAADNKSMTYGGTPPMLTASYSGFVGSDTAAVLTGAPALSTMATSASSVGSYPITAEQGTLGTANYSFIFTPGTLTVGQAAIVVSVNSKQRTYGSANPAFDGTLGGVVAGDAITAAYSTTANAGSPAGEYTITATLNDPNNKLGNYSVTNTPGTLTVGKAALGVTADSKSMAYGAPVPTLTASYSGFVGGDNATVLTGSPAMSTTATSASPTGSYPITAAQGTLAATNYSFSFGPGTMTIGQAAVVVTANSKQRTYGTANPPFDGTLSGVVAGDDITATYSTAATSGSAAGDYVITVTLNDPNNRLGNYSVANTPGTLTVTRAILAVFANDKQRAYGAVNPALDGTLTGVMNNDTISASYTTTAAASSEPGTYAITATLADPDSRLPNYTVTNTPGTLTITKAPSSVAVTTNSASLIIGSSVTLTATISVSPTLAPTGTVTFKDGGSTLGTGTLDNAGKATFSTSALAAGLHSLSAEYTGDSRYANSTSASGTVSVQDFALPATAPALTVTAGQSQTVNLAVTPLYGLTGTVTFTCAVPANMAQAACSISPVEMNGSSAVNAVVRVTTTGPHRVGAVRNPGQWYAAVFAPVFAAFVFLGVPSPKRWRGALLTMVIVVLLLGALVGCGGGGSSRAGGHTDPGTAPGNYTLTVTGTIGTASHGVNVNVTVQ